MNISIYIAEDVNKAIKNDRKIIGFNLYKAQFKISDILKTRHFWNIYRLIKKQR